MIERVLVNGVDLELDDVFAELTIRHGRGSIDDGPMASTVTLRLVNVERELVAAFSAGDVLELYLAGDVPRFRGRITDADVGIDGLAIIAVSSLGWLSLRMVGGSDWPLESWRDRLIRAFDDAGILLTWLEVGGSWASAGGDWVDYGTAGRLTLDTLDNGPQIAARVGSTETLGGYLGGEFRDSEAAVAANLPDGTVLIQQLSKRSTKPIIELASDRVAFPPEWKQADEVENDLTLEWDDGSGTAPLIHARNSSSIARFEFRSVSVRTALALETEAETRANLRVTRRGFPRWAALPIDVLELEPALTIGTPVRFHDLPAWAPDSAYLGIVEGWEDHIAPAGDGGLAWTMRLTLSDPQLSGGFGTLWYTSTKAWNAAGTAKWNNPGPLA